MSVLKHHVTLSHSELLDSDIMKGNQELILTRVPEFGSPVLLLLGHTLIE